MKVINIIYVCIIVFLISFVANAQCPPGWTSNSVNFGPDPWGCSWQVDFCTKCDITGASDNSIRVLNIKPVPVGGGCIAPDRDWLIGQIINQYYITCTPKPCAEGCTVYLIEYPSCWECHTFGSLYQGNYYYTNWQEPCENSGYCQITTKVCKESTQPFSIIACPGWNNTYLEFNVNCPEIPFFECPTEFSPDFEGEQITGPCYKRYECGEE